MAKKKKKKRVAASAPATPKKVVNYRRILYLSVCFLVAMAAYRTALNLRFLYIDYVYEGIAAVLILWYAVVNKGLERMTLPPNATEEEKADHQRRTVLGKKILGVFFAVVLTLIVDLVDLYILDYFRDFVIQ
jgi:hypothetical protein